MTEDHHDVFTTIEDLRGPCCGPHLMVETPRLILSHCEESGWLVFVDEQLLCRVVFNDTDYAEVLDTVEPTSDLLVETAEGTEEAGSETVEERLITDIGTAIAAYLRTPGSVLYQPEPDVGSAPGA